MRVRRATLRIEHVGRALRLWRKRRGISQEQLALRARVTRTYVGRVERGVISPTLVTFDRLLVVLDLSWGEFGSPLDYQMVAPK